jgi:hypothetical protein
VIGNPKKYSWRIETRICPEGPCTDVDFAPDEDGGPVYVKHRLR